MKATLLRVTVTLAMVMAFASVSAFGQGVIKHQSFVIPFAFSVGNKVLPAGEYRVSSEAELLRIQSKDGKRTITVLPIRTGATYAVTQTKLTFTFYENTYQLSQVWLADGIGRELKRQRTDSDVSQNVGVVDIVAGN
ncbi:MAG TPA: hypothetical protein VIX17_09695 [Pyrinomonadaceae bacterium]|jgi:hypothetical protein